jgi:hypothetical protein
MKTTFRDLNTLTVEERHKVAQIYDLLLAWQRHQQPGAIVPSIGQPVYSPEMKQVCFENFQETTNEV